MTTQTKTQKTTFDGEKLGQQVVLLGNQIAAMGPHFALLKYPSAVAKQENKELHDSIKQVEDLLIKQTSSIDSNFAQLRRHLITIEDRLAASDFNGIARVANSRLKADTDTLTALVNVSTGKRISEFPETSQSIDDLKESEIRPILEVLGGTPAKTLTLMQKDLRLKIGLKATRHIAA